MYSSIPEFNPDSALCDSTGTITALENEVKRLVSWAITKSCERTNWFGCRK